MTNILWTTLLFLSATLIVSQGFNTCGRPKNYANRRLDEKYLQISTFKEGEKVTYKCDVGYAQSYGWRYSTCLNGHWTSLNMQCKIKKCGSAGEIANGRFNQKGNLFGDRAYAECDEGYVLQGADFRQCLDDGWNGSIPTCVESHSLSPESHSLLPSLSHSLSRLSNSAAPASDRAGEVPAVRVKTCTHPTVQNAVLNGTKASYNPGERLLFSCSEGFHLQGTVSIIQCDQGGRWRPHPPKCARIKCPPLNILSGAVSTERRRVNTTVTIRCEDGFHLRGPTSITCEASGSWTPAVPTCESSSGQCGRLPFHPNVVLREEQLDQYQDGARVRYRCSHGYVWAEGRDSIYCEKGHWTSLQLRCQKKKCGSAGEVGNGRFVYTGVSFGDTATALCHEGYQLVGGAVRYCRAEGWDGRIPVCEVVKCPSPPEVAGADMYGPTDDGPVQYGHVVSYMCLTGTLVGAADIYCTEKGTWSAPFPQCTDVVCPFPNVMFGSRFAGFQQRYKFGNSVTFTCNPGWRLVGSRTVTCGRDGSWKPALPKCIRP